MQVNQDLQGSKKMNMTAAAARTARLLGTLFVLFALGCGATLGYATDSLGQANAVTPANETTACALICADASTGSVGSQPHALTGGQGGLGNASP
jgi:hypothetical protein